MQIFVTDGVASPSVERSEGTLRLITPLIISWGDLQEAVRDQLSNDEKSLLEQIWCEDAANRRVQKCGDGWIFELIQTKSGDKPTANEIPFNASVLAALLGL